MELIKLRKLSYYVGISLDGRIAGPGGEYDFYPLGDTEQAAAYTAGTTTLYPDTVPTAMRAAVGVADTPNRKYDTVVMGLGTYRPALDEGITNPYAHLRQYVVSSSLDPAAHPDVTVVPGEPLSLVRKLKQEDSELDIWLCGGGKLAGQLLPELDELIVKSYPVVAGAGIPAFDGEFDPTVFEAAERTAFTNGVTLTRYTRR